MAYKWIGSVLIITGCGCFGFLLSASDRREMVCLRDLIRILEFITCELQFRLSPLPEVCRKAASQVRGSTGEVFKILSDTLNEMNQPDAAVSMDQAISCFPSLPESCRAHLRLLGHSLGCYDLPGQIQEIASVRASCASALAELEKGKIQRMRSYQTLGLCTGAALAILLV